MDVLIFIHTCTHAHTHTRVCVFCMYVYIQYICVCVCAYICMCIYTHTQPLFILWNICTKGTQTKPNVILNNKHHQANTTIRDGEAVTKCMPEGLFYDLF